MTTEEMAETIEREEEHRTQARAAAERALDERAALGGSAEERRVAELRRVAVGYDEWVRWCEQHAPGRIGTTAPAAPEVG
jgi:hypothetical protein